MKKIYFWSILILFILALLPTGLWAQNDTQRSASDSQREPNTHVTATHAMDVGYAFMRTGNGSRSGGTQSGNVRKQAMQLVYTGRATDTLTRATTDCYYVFALQPKGFVIVAADNRVEPILGYSYDNNFVVEDMPEHIKGWLNDYEKQIEVVTKSARSAEADIQTKWTRLESGQPLSNTRNGNTVGPLLTTTWDQETYYNALCPEDPNGPGGHVVTGCVATAMAQLINYWGYPKHGRGVHGYSSYYGILEVNYDSTQYDFTNMPDVLNSTSTLEQVNAVAQLMYHCGVAVNMDYLAAGSGALNVDIRAALVNHFRYSPHIGYADKCKYSNSVWIGMLQNEIENGRPFIYGGFSGDTVGHGFICDGYDNNGYFHFNFGWSGNGDGWYRISAVNTGAYAFNSNQSAIMGIEPDSLSNTVYSLVGLVNGGLSQYSIGGSTFLGNELYNNPYGFLTGQGSNVNWIALCPADTSQQLVLEPILFSEPDNISDYQYVYIYDGLPVNFNTTGGQINYTSPEDLIRQYVENVHNTDYSPIISTKHGLTLAIKNLYKADRGFLFHISYDNGCRLVTNVTASVDTTTVHLSWTENGNATQWQVEYGLKGFCHGSGTLLTASDTSIDIHNLLSFKEYDVYIRPLCDTNLYGSWCQAITVMPEAKYWTDVVMSQPEGYSVADDGTVIVSSAEGLAWWAKHQIIWGGEAVPTQPNLSIISDIDLDGYLWSPVSYFSGCIDGHGHTISNMRILEHEKQTSGPYPTIWYCGLIQNYYGDTIQNLKFANPVVKSPRDQSGIIVGSGNTAIMRNCCVIDGYLQGGFGVGLLAGSIGSVTNCYATGEVHADGIAGGLVGGASKDISNCWTSMQAVTVKTEIDNHVNYQAWYGLITGGLGSEASVKNCFSDVNVDFLGMDAGAGYNLPLSYIFGYYESTNTIENISLFFSNDSSSILIAPVMFDTIISDLTLALNAFVQEKNNSEYYTWKWNNISLSPEFDDYHQVYCSNVDSVLAKPIEKDGNIALAVSWVSDSSLYWQIRITPVDALEGTPFYQTSNSSRDTITGLIPTHNYKIAVRRWCSSEQKSGWSDNVFITFDKMYWTDIVTSQPSGYIVDADSNVKITSREGLVWLSVVVNGLNNVPAYDFRGKTIRLETDVDMDGYRWLSIGYSNHDDYYHPFRGSFYGNGHTISNMYCNESLNMYNYVGLFGSVREGIIEGVTMVNVNINGCIGAGSVVAFAENTIVSDCSAQGTVRSISGVGGIAGSIRYDNLYYTPPILPEMKNCSFCGTIFGSKVVGGLVGEAYQSDIKNVFTQCEIFNYGTRMMEKGGVIGILNSSVLKNGYSKSILHYDTLYMGGVFPYPALDYSGIVIGLMAGEYGSSVYNTYYENNDNLLSFNSIDNNMDYSVQIIDTSAFKLYDNVIQLETPITINDTSYTDMLDALNAWVFSQSDSTLRLWVPDSSGLPKFGEYFVPIYHIPDNVQAIDLTTHTDSTLIKVSWTQRGEPSFYEVRCMIYGRDSIIQTVYTDSTSCFIAGLPIGEFIDISVRAVYNNSFYTLWSESEIIIQQCPYWTDIITIQPESFNVINRKVIINTAEDLAWLSSVMNGLNGAVNYDIETVVLANDIDMNGYRWMPINSFSAVFDGENHSIKNLYSNEIDEIGGEIGGLITHNNGTLRNINLFNARVYGTSVVGGLVSYNEGAIINCGFRGIVYGTNYLGGLVGANGNNADNNSNIKNCYVNGEIRERKIPSINYSGWYYGGITHMNNGIINNCYFTGNVEGRRSATIVSRNNLAWTNYHPTSSTITNCYSYTTNEDMGFVAEQFGNPIVSDTISFQRTSDNLPLLDSVLIDGIYYFDLLSALNAWINTYDTDGSLSHWVHDSISKNDGFPIFEEIKYNLLTVSVADSTPYGIVSGGGSFNHVDQIKTISATPDYGYHFAYWNDGNTSNPRTIMLTRDTTFIAVFEKNKYQIIGSASAKIDYNFDFENASQDVQWAFQNANYLNRWCIATLEDTNRALFISNNNGISNTCDNGVNSDVFAYAIMTLDTGLYNYSYNWRYRGGGSFSYLHVALLPASSPLSSYGWEYSWYYPVLPRTIITLDGGYGLGTFSSYWNNKNGQVNIPTPGEYKIVFFWHNNDRTSTNNAAAVDNIQFYNDIPENEILHGYVLGSDTVYHLDTVMLTAVPYEGYRFVKWNDGNTENPRTVIATSDKFFIALFEEAPSIIVVDSIVACDSYLWHGNVYAASTMLFDTLPATGGGDSVVAHYLMVNHPAHTAITETACESYVWTHADGTTQTCTVSGDYTYSHIDANGCTQVDTLHLTVYHTVNSASFVTTCDSYTWTHADGTTQVCNISDDYIYSYENAYGCPQVDTLHLTVNHATSGEITISACDSFDWYDSTYTESGDYVLTLSNMTGCDSVVTLHLTVNHPAHTAITETACESYVWTHADGTTQTYFASGDYLYSHSDVNGCVQVDTLHLAIYYPSTSVDEQIACGPFTWINGETYTSSVFGPTYTLTNEAGCDSVVTLSLTMYQSDTTQFSITACNNFVWGDNTYTETGDYAQTSEGLNGCLSVTIMHLTINYSDTTEESATSCDSYLWHGNNYTESGDYTVYYTNTDGCNSMANLHLTVNHSSVGEIVATACENYEWHGIVYTESGDYEHTLTAANGCDSVVTLHLTVNEDVATEFTITTADSCYIWNGQSYCASGDYTQSFETVNGCDSVVTLHLTITVGIDDYDFANVMKLYPNPTSDLVNVQLTINNEQLGEVGIQVFDVYGRLLEVINMADARGASLQTAQIDLSQYAKGVYFVKAVSEGKVIAVRKVVKR